jgi:UDP-N-acetylmuramate dehydrogenase
MAQLGESPAHPAQQLLLDNKSTLALVNAGDATTADLLALAREIVSGVRATFGVTLTPEPILIGVTL